MSRLNWIGKSKMANVTQYQVLFYGSSDGYQGSRGQIALFNGANVVGYIRFHDSGMPFPIDSQSGGQIVMHLPSAMFEAMLAVLRSNKSFDFVLNAGRAMLESATVPVGTGQ